MHQEAKPAHDTDRLKKAQAGLELFYPFGCCFGRSGVIIMLNSTIPGLVLFFEHQRGRR